MKQQEIYQKDITRYINGVIKADSQSELANEVIEYVITAEQRTDRLLPNLFHSLIPGQRPSCVWISGDFGSGKSHLLKILSYVLENQLEIDGRKCGEIFADKAGEDISLKKDIQLSCEVPTESVLFNIQEKLDGIAKSSIDPVLNIFLKEFNRKLGFDDKKPEIANIERYFANHGKYEWLQSEYQNRFGESWVEARKSILLKKQRLAQLLAEMEGIDESTAKSNLDAEILNYKLDIDGFVALVKEHLDKQPANSRFIFFVDEVGQFIGKDVQRMLSLQTIAEGLVDKTNGRALMFVTSQMDIEATVGNLERQQENDFSRIQGRFTTRLNLTSANADEVIQRRLLEKTPEAEAELCRVYEREKNILKSLFNFGDNSQFRSRYETDKQFAINYPFIDYQFDLLQNSIVYLSKNNAFSGQQQSVGERSMLNITQDVAKAYMNKQMDQIVQFCDMYEGIRGILQTKVQTDIQQAERALDDEMAVRVLKALFMLKYVKGFPTTTDNITRIMLPTLDTDFPEYRIKIQEALNKLVRVSFIEKGANDEYHYQTNEEKDIENEIKNEELQPDTINNELKKIFRDEIFSESKIRLSTNKIFPFGRIVDEQQDGRDAEMYLHILTPLFDAVGNSNESLRMYSLQHTDQLCVVLAEDRYLSEDLVMFKKADKCLTRLLSANGDNYRQQIVTDKRRVNARRREDIVRRLTELTKNARLFLCGNELTDIRVSDVNTRLKEGMTCLIETVVYRNLSMLQIEYDDAMLKQIISNTSNGSLFADEMDNCTTEVLNRINYNKLQSIRSKVKDLVDYFRSKPYGWYEVATLCILAKLYKLDKVNFRLDGANVPDRDLYFNMTNASKQAVLIVEVEETITNAQVTQLKQLYREYFDDESCNAQSAKDVHNAFISRMNQELVNLRRVKDSNNQYKFVEPLATFIPTLETITRYQYPALYQKNAELNDILDRKKDEIDNIYQFVSGRQFDIFRRVDSMHGNTANLGFVETSLCDRLNAVYESMTPWRMMNEAQQVIEEISTAIKEAQEQARAEVRQVISDKLSAITSLPAFESLKEDQKGQIQQLFSVLSNKVVTERFIGNIRAMMQETQEAYQRSIDSINSWLEAAQAAARRAAEEAVQSGQPVPAQPTTQHVIHPVVGHTEAMKINYPKSRLETKEDVEDYISKLRSRLLGYIDDNKFIMLN